MNIAIIGAGQVGGSLGRAWARAGHQIYYGVREPQSDKVNRLLAETGSSAAALPVAEAAKLAAIVAFATPWAATIEAVLAAGDLGGKIVIDCTNPLKFVPGVGLELVVGFHDSGAETIARALPGARVVKSFNTYGWENFADARYPNAAGLLPVMFLAGDDAGAKHTVSGLASDIGFEPFDAGSLRAARDLEPLAMIWIRKAMSGERLSGFTWARLTR